MVSEELQYCATDVLVGCRLWILIVVRLRSVTVEMALLDAGLVWFRVVA